MKKPLLTEKLAQACPGLRIETDPEVLLSHGRDWTRFRDPQPAAVVFPGDVRQVVRLVKAARQLELALVPSGGRTGLSGGAVAAHGEVVVALDRMRRVVEFDPVDRLLTVEAGMVTAAVQAFARDQGLFYPVSFAAEGSASIGGNVATNAGGIRVLRYGLTRDRVAGLKAVDGRGRVLDLNRGLIKNASGYDLRHLLIGSEGTLAIIVEATLRLETPPPPAGVLLLGVTGMPVILDLLRELRSGFELSACEFFSADAMRMVCQARSLRQPMDSDPPFYLLVEFDLPEQQAAVLQERAAALLETAVERGWAVDALLSQSAAQAADLWSYREGISEAASPHTPYKNDLSVRLSRMPAFLAALEKATRRLFPQFQVLWYGHVGDGNLHMNVLKPGGLDIDEFERMCKELSRELYELTAQFGGSISAEHGIGLLKRPFLAHARSEAEIALMRGIKQVFDPDGILNPGKLL